MADQHTATSHPSAIYVWLVPSEQVLEQPGSWRIRKWDTEPFPEANFSLSGTRDSIIEECAKEIDGIAAHASTQEWLDAMTHVAKHIRSLKGKPPVSETRAGIQGNNLRNVGEALLCAEHALTHPASDQQFALTAVRQAIDICEGAAKRAVTESVPTVKPELLAALRDYTQQDPEGVWCGVSRQAVDEAIDILAKLPETA